MMDSENVIDITLLENKNGVICRFLGAELLSHHRWNGFAWFFPDEVIGDVIKQKSYKPDMLQFEASMDWLFLVIQKIEQDGYVVNIHGNQCTVIHKEIFYNHRTRQELEACGEFVFWYEAVRHTPYKAVFDSVSSYCRHSLSENTVENEA